MSLNTRLTLVIRHECLSAQTTVRPLHSHYQNVYHHFLSYFLRTPCNRILDSTKMARDKGPPEFVFQWPVTWHCSISCENKTTSAWCFCTWAEFWNNVSLYFWFIQNRVVINVLPHLPLLFFAQRPCLPIIPYIAISFEYTSIWRYAYIHVHLLMHKMQI